MKVLDLFSGIGGFSLGLERAGMTTVAFCEIDKKAQQVLRKHWPNVPIFEDVCTLTKELLDERGITIDVICGGFPCQDISLAGKGAGIEGERSGLWTEYARIISELRPKFVIVENVSALLSRGLDRVLGDLAEIGYDAEWHCISASAVGAPHRRDRVWIIAYPEAKSQRREREEIYDEPCWVRPEISYTMREGLERQRTLSSRIGSELSDTRNNSWWATEPNVGRVAHGVSGRVDRLKQLGNAVVPQIPELIGRAIYDLQNQKLAPIPALQRSKATLDQAIS